LISLFLNITLYLDTLVLVGVITSNIRIYFRLLGVRGIEAISLGTKSKIYVLEIISYNFVLRSWENCVSGTIFWEPSSIFIFNYVFGIISWESSSVSNCNSGIISWELSSIFNYISRITSCEFRPWADIYKSRTFFCEPMSLVVELLVILNRWFLRIACSFFIRLVLNCYRLKGFWITLGEDLENLGKLGIIEERLRGVLSKKGVPINKLGGIASDSTTKTGAILIFNTP
jgi:hypothetical protein